MRRGGRRAVSLLSGLLIGTLSTLPAAAQDDAGESVRVVGAMPLLYPDGYPSNYFSDENERSVRAVDLVINPKRRRAYQLFELRHGGEQTRIAIRAFNLDTLRPLGPGGVGTPGYGEAPVGKVGMNNGRNGFVYALDDGGGRLFLLARIGSQPASVWRFDLVALDEGREFATQFSARMDVPLAGDLRGGDVRAIDYYQDTEGRGRVLALNSTGGSPTSPPARLDAWDAETGEPVWEQPFDVPKSACPSTDTEPQAVTQTPLWRSRQTHHLFLMCKNGNRAWLVRLEVDPATDRPHDPILVPPREIPGPLEPYAEAIADTSSDRVLVVAGAGANAYMIGVIDGRAGTYVGESGFMPQRGRAAEAFALGVDPSVGRFYALAGDYLSTGEDNRPLRGGLFVLHGRLTPMPQSLQLPGFSYPSTARIGVDPGGEGLPRRVFIRRGRGDYLRQCVRHPNRTVSSRATPDGGCPTDQHYTVLIDPIPEPRQPSASDLDVHTQGIREVPERTGRTFDASGSAYGVRVRFVGGLQGASHDEINRVLEFEVGDQRGKRLRPACWPTDREALAAYVARVGGSDDGFFGRAMPLRIDAVTQEDLTAPGSRCRPLVTPYQLPADGHIEDIDVDYGPVDDLAGSSWNIGEASCRGDSSDEQRAEQPVEKDGIAPPAGALPHGFSSTANCHEGGTRADGHATAAPLASEVIDALTVGKSSARVQIEPLDDGGLRVTSEAEVRSINIGDVFIDAVRAYAEVEAAGRRGTADGTFTREVCGVKIGSGPASPCYKQVVAAGCDASPLEAGPEALAEEQQRRCEGDGFAWMLGRINQALGGRAAFVARSPNAELLDGTPGGYLAAVQKAAEEVIADSLLIRDFLLEVPGLEFTTYRDSGQYGPGRQVVQLAGVRAAATYGTYCLPPLRPRAGQCVEASLGGIAVPRESVLDEPVPTEPVLPLAEDPPVSDGPDRAAAPVPRGGGLIDRSRAFLVRSLTEGLLTTSVWMLFGIAAYLVVRRSSLSDSIAKDG